MAHTRIHTHTCTDSYKHTHTHVSLKTSNSNTHGSEAADLFVSALIAPCFLLFRLIPPQMPHGSFPLCLQACEPHYSQMETDSDKVTALRLPLQKKKNLLTGNLDVKAVVSLLCLLFIVKRTCSIFVSVVVLQPNLKKKSILGE